MYCNAVEGSGEVVPAALISSDDSTLAMHLVSPQPIPPPSCARKRVSTGQNRSVSEDCVKSTPNDIGPEMLNHVLRKYPSGKTKPCCLKAECLTAINSDNSLFLYEEGHGRELDRTTRTHNYCGGCRDENGVFIPMCAMCFLFWHAKQNIWQLNKDSTCTPMVQKTKSGVKLCKEK